MSDKINILDYETVELDTEKNELDSIVSNCKPFTESSFKSFPRTLISKSFFFSKLNYHSCPVYIIVISCNKKRL